MKNKTTLTIMIIIFIILMAGCGPSPEEQAATAAAMTAAAATNTPMPSATPIPPTPVPYDLTVIVLDDKDNPINEANVILPESGDEQPVQTDLDGRVSWMDLPGETISLFTSSQGYAKLEQTSTIERGSNEIKLVMERDPFQILPAEACEPGQDLLYLEDFEDGDAQEWQDLERPKWSFGDDEINGKTLSLYNPDSGASTQYPAEFGNAVWSFDIKMNGLVDMHINWHFKESDDGLSRYLVAYKSNEHFQMHFIAPGTGYGLGEVSPPVFEEGTWYRFSFAYYDGKLDVWADNKLILGVDHKETLIETGGFGFMIEPQEGLALDNVVVCGLNEPFQPVVEETQ